MGDLTLQAGTTIITPSEPGELGGYIARNGALSTGTHDDLEATLIVLEHRSTRVAWLSLDAIGVTAELDVQLRAAIGGALDDATLVIAASHSHSAPLGWTGGIHPGNPGHRSAQAADELVERIAALARAVAGQPGIPVRAEWGSSRVEGVGTNRLAPDGPQDDTVGVLALRDGDGGLRAMLFDFATHPTVLGAANLQWSADWPGAARAALRAALDPPPVIGFLQGAAGDVSTRFTRRADDFDEVARLGARVTTEVLDVLEVGGRPLGSDLRTSTALVTLARRPLPDPEAAEVAVQDAAAALARTTGAPLDPAVRLAQTRHDGATVQRALVAAQLPSELELPLAAVAIGEVAWLHVPVELFASIGQRIASASPFAVTRVVGYSNGYAGYLADAPAHVAGSYEALSSVFDADAVDPFVDAASDLLAALSHRSLASTEPA